MSTEGWRSSARQFFAGRAGRIAGAPSMADLCVISGRDTRLWLDERLYADLVASILDQCGLDAGGGPLLEVGCAAGFLAHGLAEHVDYVGVDVDDSLLKVAERLGLPNARFVTTDGALPFEAGVFAAAISYDVITNYPRLADFEPVIEDMLRVVKPGGAVMIGSVPDGDTQGAYEAACVEVSARLTAARGPVRSLPPDTGAILCYYFRKEEFAALADRLHADVAIRQIHRLNPYADYRFNAVFRRR